MYQRQATLPARSLMDILNEAFVIYGKRLPRLLGMAGLVQAPVNAVMYVLLAGVPNVLLAEEPVFGVDILLRALAALLVWSLGAASVFAAVVCAVGQHYLLAEVSPAKCYAKVFSKAVPLVLLAVVLPLTLTLGIALVFLLAIPLVIAIVALVYWSMAIPAVVMEGSSYREALRRSFRLVKGSWLRTFGCGVVVALVGFGLGVVVTIPFAVIISAIGPDASPPLRAVVDVAANAVVASAVLPVIFISWTLLYYDLRVRKENYSIQELSREMGTAAVVQTTTR